jgi:hypothetical protein
VIKTARQCRSRAIFLLPTVFFTLARSAAAEAPFAPLANQPDHVVSMVESDYRKKIADRKVTHHGDWTRVDRIRDSYPVTEYVSANGTANVRIYGQGSAVSLVRGRESDYSAIDREARNTGERQTHLGENCTVWDVWRTRRERTGYNLSHLSCITDDGIELWQRSVGDLSPNESTEATHVERMPVELDEARPSRALLTLDWWDQNVPAPTAPAISDHETVMEFSGSSAEPRKSIRITRRLGPWQFLEETSDGVLRSLHITHDSHQMRFDYSNGEPGAPKRLDITRAASGNPATPEFGQPRAMNRSETILGETCGWFDMTPGMADTGRSACLTRDGIVLKEERYSRSGGGTWTAVRLTRRPVSLDEIKPPATLLEPQLWGID